MALIQGLGVGSFLVFFFGGLFILMAIVGNRMGIKSVAPDPSAWALPLSKALPHSVPPRSPSACSRRPALATAPSSSPIALAL